jgi:hypothetical protein
MEKAPQLLVSGWVMRAVHRPVVLAEKLLAFSFREVFEDHQRIGGVFRRLCGHATQLTPAYRPHPVRRTGQGVGGAVLIQAVQPTDQVHHCRASILLKFCCLTE